MLLFKYFRISYFLGLLSLFIGVLIFIFAREVDGQNFVSEFIGDLKNFGGIKKKEEQIEKDALKIISLLSLEEKVGQFFHIAIEGAEFKKDTQKLIEKYKPGGIILFSENLKTPSQISRLNEGLQRKSIKSNGIPLLISTDQEGGRIKRLGPEASTPFPSAMAFGQTENPLYVEEAAFITAHELLRLGINWVLAPVLDINNNPGNPVINIRSFGSEPGLVAQMAKAYIIGNRKALSLSAIKHFPGHGDTDMDSHLSLPRINKSLEEMEKTELFPFRSVIQDKEARAEALMTAHILFPSLDPDKPATLSPKILKKILRKRLGFDGLVTTDAMEMKAISQRYSPGEAARLAFQAGTDMILLGERGKGHRRFHLMYKSLLHAFQKKELNEKELDRALERQLRLKIKRGLFQRWKSPYRKQGKEEELYWKKQEKKARKQYKRIIGKYAKRGLHLNTLIARDSIRALDQAFYGLSLKEFKRARLLLGTQAMRTEALKMGIAPRQIHHLKGRKDILGFPLQHGSRAEHIWLLEVNSASLPYWNKLAVWQKKKGSSFTLIALYTGNPFLKIERPGAGAVLVSCSDTEESQKALVYRALYPEKMIPKINLILE